MANFSFSLRSTLGLLPNTDKVENARIQLEQEFEKLNAFAESELLAEFTKLESFNKSQEFVDFKKNILGLDYKKTQEFAKEQKYLKLKKSKSIVNYFKVSDSADYKQFIKTQESDELAKYNELTKDVGSAEHANKKAQLAQSLKAELDKAKEFQKLKKQKNFKTYFAIVNSSNLNLYNRLKDSEELAHYMELSQQVKTTKEKEIKAEFKALKQNSDFKTYFKFEKSAALNTFKTLDGSKELSYYTELEQYVNSAEYQQNIESFKFENSQEYKNEQDLLQLKNNESIKHWLKYQKAKTYLLFKKTKNSTELSEYNELHELVNSDKFIEYKTYMLDKEKYSKTDEFTKEQRYKELQNNDEIKWYLKTKDSHRFNQLKAWKVTFEDTFSESKIDEQRWMNGFFWGKMLVNDRYVMAGDKQYYTDSKNFQLDGKTLKIITKNEKAEGKVWHPKNGFYQQKFDYTSGMLCTAHSFRQQYGKFEAKIKIDSNGPVYQAFWLKGERILPEIDIFRFNLTKANKMHMAAINGDPSESKKAKAVSTKLNGASFAKDFFIYSMDWSPEKISWKINGVEVYSTTSAIPSEPMYIMLSAGIKQNPKGEQVQSAYEIDWIRCYEKVDLAG